MLAIRTMITTHGLVRQSGNAVPRRNWWKLAKTMFPGKKNELVTLVAMSKYLRKTGEGEKGLFGHTVQERSPSWWGSRGRRRILRS